MDMISVDFLAIKLIHGGIGFGVGLLGLWLIKLARLRGLYDSQQDELEILGQRLKDGEVSLSPADAQFGTACAIVEAVRILAILGCATWLAVAL